MEEWEDYLSGIRRREIHVFFSLYPSFRRFLKDRREAKNSTEKEWSYRRERNGYIAVQKFIELGPTFIKLGQILSARSDILPKEYIKAFELLQDQVPPAPFDEVKPIIEREIGKLDDTFEYFNRNAISGASLGQVYLAKYKGKDVVVKVNRPNAEKILKKDIEILTRILKLAKGRIENFLYISIENILKDFRKRVFDELDYRKEAYNADHIRKNIKGREKILIPGIIRELSSRSVLTMEYLPGIKISDVEKLKEKNFDLSRIAYDVDTSFLRMLLRDDMFHADPHPGNISIAEDGSIILYDFGMVGDLDKKTRFNLLSFYDSLTRRDIDGIIDSLIAMEALSPAANRGVIRKSIEVAMSGLSGKRADDSEMRELLEIANGVVFEFPFRLPTSLVLYMRMSSLLEGICLSLDPDFRFVRVLRKLFEEEGLLKELYKGQIEKFQEDAINSFQYAFELIPLIKRKLEGEVETPPLKEKRQKIPFSVFGGVLIFSGIYEYGIKPGLISGIILIAGFIISLYSLI